MDNDILAFFMKTPEALPLYERFVEEMSRRLPPYSLKVQKTQISFANKYNFAFVSLPMRRIKGYSDICIIVTFGLRYQVVHPRIFESVEPYPNRWTHHVIVQRPEEIDAQLMDWIQEAFAFSMIK